jgi:hypothetical protein
MWSETSFASFSEFSTSGNRIMTKETMKFWRLTGQGIRGPWSSAGIVSRQLLGRLQTAWQKDFAAIRLTDAKLNFSVSPYGTERHVGISSRANCQTLPQSLITCPTPYRHQSTSMLPYSQPGSATSSSQRTPEPDFDIDEQRYPCTRCDATFSLGRDLKRHIDCLHTREKKFFCPVEACKFAKGRKPVHRLDNLRRHIRIRHPEIPQYTGRGKWP